MLKLNASLLGNLFLLCLFGSIFVQPKPSLYPSLIGVLMGVVAVMLYRSKGHTSAPVRKQSYFIWSALIVWPVGHLVIALSHQPYALEQLGNPFRAFIAIGVMFYLARVATKLNFLYLGVGVACGGAFVHAVYDKIYLKLVRSVGWFNNEIHFGDYSALVGVFAVTIACYVGRLCSAKRYALFLLGCLAFVAAGSSGTRTAALGAICLIPLFWMRPLDAVHSRLRLATVFVIVALAMPIALSERVRTELRYYETITDVKTVLAGGGQSSIGDRKQMWIAALDMAQESPFVGIGLNNFAKELKIRLDNREILPLLSMHNQAHSQPLHSLATGGIILLACYAFFVAMPLAWFAGVYRRSSANSELRLLAYLGIANIICHIIFGLTAAIFDIQVFSSLYMLSLAALAGLCISVQQNASSSIAHPTLNHG